MNKPAMQAIGYTDRFGVRPGEAIQFMVSCQRERYRAAVVRLRHGDLNPKGPGFRASEIPSPIDGEYRGRVQGIFPGSYVRIDDKGALAGLRRFTIRCWVYPTLIGTGAQALVSRWSEKDAAGFCLFLTPEGDLALKLGDGQNAETVRAGASLTQRQWHFVAAAVDLERSEVLLYRCPRTPWPGAPGKTTAIHKIRTAKLADARVPALIAAAYRDSSGERGTAADFFNGKIDRPAIMRGAFGEAAIEGARDRAGGDPVAAWDFAAGIAGATVADVSGNGLHGAIVNQPTRGVTGHNWTGREQCFAHAPEEYGAIHFHEDDIEDAGWEPDVRLTIPDDWRSGVYALRLTAGDFEDYVPFIVRPKKTGANPAIAFLAPTLTYYAYANDHSTAALGRADAAPSGSTDDYIDKHATPYEAAVFRYIVANRLQCLYERHADGSPVCHASRLRPLCNVRPRYNKANLEYKYPHLLSCDLYLVDWLEEKGFDYDTIDDELLHAEGRALLDRYKVILTGAHPEYWTYEMLTALKGYLEAGGRLMYLGGNGFYWVTTLGEDRPHVMEIRRGVTGTRTWTSEPGEWFHAMTGEMGGLWKSRGLAPHGVVGVGFAAAGLGASPYRRTEASRGPELAFMFEGVEDDILGDFGLHMGAAAGWEIDRADMAEGTPANAVVLASSFGHSDDYQRVIEELQEAGPHHGGTESPFVRADMTYVETPNGGAIFSVGSISYCGSLSHNNYRNNISRVTENVLRRFEGGGGR